ncbi:MAG TPA: hypothetical protein VFR28_11375 [Allosphingosinicella sp.]|jgi:hypothetical protein|nr:hypothetical protein [Allosphingosinicella sp.]
MKNGSKIAALLATAALSAAPALARPKPQDARSNALIQGIAACRDIADEKARLACYDEAGARLSQAVEKKELVVLDRQEINQTRRSLFGFGLPDIPLFRGEGGKDSGQIETVIAGVSPLANGKWQIRLEDGAVWQTTEPWTAASDPKSGQKIVIRRGMMGNYFLRINGRTGISGMRVR